MTHQVWNIILITLMNIDFFLQKKEHRSSSHFFFLIQTETFQVLNHFRYLSLTKLQKTARPWGGKAELWAKLSENTKNWKYHCYLFACVLGFLYDMPSLRAIKVSLICQKKHPCDVFSQWLKLGGVFSRKCDNQNEIFNHWTQNL